MKRTFLFALIIFISANGQSVAGDTADEIEHLFDFVSRSNCVFIRNGVEHGPREAAAHMRRKYDFYREDIDSAEKFIELSASKSTLTGIHYTIRCHGNPSQRTGTWLLSELRRYRLSRDQK